MLWPIDIKGQLTLFITQTGNCRQHQHHRAISQSTYCVEGGSDEMAATVNSEARRKANLRVLQRLDSGIVDLAITASHVVLYEFNNGKSNWEKKNVEGSLFVTKRAESPRFKLIVLNRSSTENLEVPISSTFQLQNRDPYMIFKDTRTDSSGVVEEKIRGIWFHDGDERDKIASYLDNIVKSLIQIDEMEKNRQQTRTADHGGNVNGQTAKDAGAALLSTLTQGMSIGDSAQSTQPASPSAASPSTDQNLVLDKKSLQLSLMSLMQDERFIDLIHAQYIKVVQSRSARQNQQQGQHQQNHRK